MQHLQRRGAHLAVILLAVSSACSTPPGGQPDASTARDVATARDATGVDTVAPTDAPAADAVSDSVVAHDGALPAFDAGGPSDRTLTFVNQCAVPLQVGATGGYTQPCGAGNTCPEGQACFTERMPPGCFWSLPAPAVGSLHLAPHATAIVVLSAPAMGAVKWSGNIYARTGCADDGSGCQTGICPGTGCRPGEGADGPLTLAEFTLQTNANDYYDVSLIQGVNVGMSMAPDPGTAIGPAPAAPYADYWCGNPGGRVPSNTALGACTWSFDTTVGGVDRRTVLREVLPGGAACTSDATCAAGSVCGLAPVTATTVGRVCGAPIGWWSAHELCAYTDDAFGDPLNCAAAVPGQGTVSNLLACDGPDATTCYTGTPSATCCGCPAWSSPSTLACLNTNAAWNADVLPWATFLKNACPTAYSFQYDDPTSTFTCRNTGDVNHVDYTITFCP